MKYLLSTNNRMLATPPSSSAQPVAMNVRGTCMPGVGASMTPNGSSLLGSIEVALDGGGVALLQAGSAPQSRIRMASREKRANITWGVAVLARRYHVG